MQERAKRRGDKPLVHSGDSVDDDMLGVGIIEKIDGGMMTIIFGTAACDGDPQGVPRAERPAQAPHPPRLGPSQVRVQCEGRGGQRLEWE